MAEVKPSAETLVEIFRRMTLISRNDELTRKAIRTGRLVTPYYSPKGQEAIPAALSVSLREDDQLCTIYRGVHDILAKGMPLEALWAEQGGRETGACKGRGGPLHFTHAESGVMVTTGIVGSSMPIANGLAWAAQMEGSDRVVVASFGDGASNIGAFHESLNLASLWKLPVIFLCQNNRYGEHTRYEKSTSAKRIADRGVAYDMAALRIDGNDPVEVWKAGHDAVARARAGDGPTLIEAMTFRFHGHVMGDADKYMDKEEKAAAIAADPTKLFRARLLQQGVADETALSAIESEIDARIEAAIAFALNSPWPDPAGLTDYVLAKQVA